MATASRTMAESAGKQAGMSLLARWLRPSFFDLLLISLPLWYFGVSVDGAGLLLRDADTGWHIRTGDWILSHGQFVYNDFFSFSKPGQPWFAWEWLTEILYSLLHRANGFQGILVLSVALSSLYCGLIFRHLMWRGVNLFIAMVLALAGFTGATVHMLARPHMWTMVFVALAAWLMERDLRQPTRWIWLLLPLTALWANLHAGWLALVVMLALATLGSAAERFFGESDWKTVRRYALLASGCFAMSLVNPYTWRLPVHMVTFLSQGWVKELNGEYLSPSFRTENMTQFEIVLLASAAAACLMALRKRFVGPLLILFWAHSSLVSARHIPVFLAVALPFLGEEASRLWSEAAARARRNSTFGILNSLAEEAAPGARRMSLWPALVALVAASPLLPVQWNRDFSKEDFPVEIAARQRETLKASRVFTSDQWANYLLYRSYPAQRVFFDGRTDYYGEKIVREYSQTMAGDAIWEEVFAKYRVDAALLRPKVALSGLLRASPEWVVADEDKQAVLYRRRTHP